MAYPARATYKHGQFIDNHYSSSFFKCRQYASSIKMIGIRLPGPDEEDPTRQSLHMDMPASAAHTYQNFADQWLHRPNKEILENKGTPFNSRSFGVMTALQGSLKDSIRCDVDPGYGSGLAWRHRVRSDWTQIARGCTCIRNIVCIVVRRCVDFTRPSQSCGRAAYFDKCER